jgi:hypothetical protein
MVRHYFLTTKDRYFTWLFWFESAAPSLLNKVCNSLIKKIQNQKQQPPQGSEVGDSSADQKVTDGNDVKFVLNSWLIYYMVYTNLFVGVLSCFSF